MGSRAWNSSGTSPIYPQAVCLLYLIIYFNHKRQLLGMFCPTLQRNTWPSSAQSSLLSSSKSGNIQRPLDDDRTNCIHQQEECTSVGSSPASDQTSFKVQLNISSVALMCLKFHVWWKTIIFTSCTCACLFVNITNWHSCFSFHLLPSDKINRSSTRLRSSVISVAVRFLNSSWTATCTRPADSCVQMGEILSYITALKLIKTEKN